MRRKPPPREYLPPRSRPKDFGNLPTLGEIRTITVRDVAGYRACVDRVARERTFIAITEAYPEPETRAFVKDMIARELPFYVAVANARIVGWCEIFVVKSRRERPGFGHAGALSMAIDVKYRGWGLGERLLRAAIDHADRIGLERVALQVFSNNAAALALYAKLGFEREGVKRRERKLDGHYDDLVLMARLR